MADPALWRITEKIKALLIAERPDVHWFTERSEADALTETELPGGVIRAVQVQINPGPEYIGQRDLDGWVAVVQIDLHSASQGLNLIDRTNQSSFASIVKVFNDNPTLDGLAANANYTGMSGSEDHSFDVGITITEVTVDFFTVRGRFDQLVGPNGLIVP